MYKLILPILFMIILSMPASACIQYGYMPDCTDYQRQALIDEARDQAIAQARLESQRDMDRQMQDMQREMTRQYVETYQMEKQRELDAK